MLHPSQMGEAVDDACQCGDDDQRWEHNAQRGHDAADNTGLLLPYEGGGVYSDDAGGALADGKIVHQLLVCSPALVLHDLALEDGQHGHTAAEGHDAHLGKGEEQLSEKFCVHARITSFYISVQSPH